jgi:hypothetical protein
MLTYRIDKETLANHLHETIGDNQNIRFTHTYQNETLISRFSYRGLILKISSFKFKTEIRHSIEIEQERLNDPLTIAKIQKSCDGGIYIENHFFFTKFLEFAGRISLFHQEQNQLQVDIATKIASAIEKSKARFKARSIPIAKYIYCYKWEEYSHGMMQLKQAWSFNLDPSIKPSPCCTEKNGILQIIMIQIARPTTIERIDTNKIEELPHQVKYLHIKNVRVDNNNRFSIDSTGRIKSEIGKYLDPQIVQLFIST